MSCGDRLATLQDMVADQLRRRRRAGSAAAAPLLRRSLEEQRVDEANISQARAAYLHMAMDRARAHCNAAPVLGDLFTMHLQEIALREAADMVAARIETGRRTSG